MAGKQFLYWTQGGTASFAEGLSGILLCQVDTGLYIDYITTGSVDIADLVTVLFS